MTIKDAIICITYEDIITTARCNGESIMEAYKGILEISLEDAQALVEEHEEEMEEMARN